MSKTPAHFGSARCAGYLRRLRQERDAVRDHQAILDGIEVALPSDFEGDENVSYTNVLAGEVKGARLKVNGKITARATVAGLVAKVREAMADHAGPIGDLTRKLNSLGVRAR
jgi:hypothetical protein